MARCSTHTESGRPCQFPARNGSAHCINHDPAYAETRAANARAGGIASGEARKPIPLSEVHVDFSTRAGIQAAAEAVATLEFIGRISPARSRNLIRALSLAARNFEAHGPIHGGFHYQQPEQLAHARHQLNKNLAAISEEAALRDAPRDKPAAQPSATDAAKVAAADRLWERLGAYLNDNGFID